MTGTGEPIILTSTTRYDDVAQILYGLELRGVRAEFRSTATGSRYDIVLIHGDERIARSAIEPIWDAILEGYTRAVDAHNRCLSCGYDVSGLTPPIVCPECGVDLDSIQTRRALRDGTPLRDPHRH